MLEWARISTRTFAGFLEVPASHVLVFAFTFALSLALAFEAFAAPSPRSAVALSLHVSPLAANVTHLVFVGAVYLQMIGAPTCITLLWVGAFFC